MVEVGQKKHNSYLMYHRACKIGVLDRLYHLSHMTSIASSHNIFGLHNVLDEWSYLTKIKERKAQASMSMIGGQGNILDVDENVGLVVLDGVLA